MDVLQSEVEATHPVFENLDTMILGNCKSDKFRGSSLDYHLLMWQKEGRGAVVECWEPFERKKSDLITLVGALEVLASQYEFACSDAEL